MDGADLDQALYARMRWNTPLSAEHADLLEAAAWHGSADRALCIGAAHAFGGSEPAVNESTFRAGRQEWLLAHGGDPRAQEVRDWLDTRERQYVEVYRGILGFAYLVLAH
jgi:hypothetical protein